MKSFKLGNFEIFWLNGGEFELDGGTMFGVVPKVLWSKKYPADEGDSIRHEDNYIKLLNYPLLIKTPDSLVLIETGLGNKMTEKQKQIFRVIKDWDLPEELNKLGFTRQDINYVILTHCDFDHAGGIVMYNADGEEELTFPNARHVVQKLEWEDAMHPDIRSENTYWPQNFSKLKGTENLQLVEGNFTVCEGVEVQHTGGHTRGHQIVRIQSDKETAYHLADLLPTHVHFKPLWIMAYDNFPLDVISLKQKYETKGIRENAWFTFYHDPSMYACKFDIQGQVAKKVAHEVAHKPAAQKNDIPIQNLNVRKDKRVTLSCPDCLLVREISVDKHAGRKHFLTVKCPCGTTYGVNLNFRKHYRKDVSIGGYYTADDADVGWADAGNVPTVPINCRIKNISMGGLGFTTLSRMRVQVGDTLNVKFTLDKVPPEIVEKEVIVRTIQDTYIGCEFTQISGFSDRTLGFYLMK
jgi:glyoxylase-like metal-dependent hydrolase (beta-lactamase superfamily II)